jgi:hypothetical protein
MLIYPPVPLGKRVAKIINKHSSNLLNKFYVFMAFSMTLKGFHTISETLIEPEPQYIDLTTDMDDNKLCRTTDTENTYFDEGQGQMYMEMLMAEDSGDCRLPISRDCKFWPCEVQLCVLMDRSRDTYGKQTFAFTMPNE